jgi:tRNA:m4X modification enzyme
MEPPPPKRQKAPPPPVPEGWDRCHAYMDRKARFCRQEVLPALVELGYFFCGNHRHLCPESVGSKRRSDRLRRIPCPIDPTHYIYEDMLEKHIQKCPKAVALELLKLESYYCQDCNCGGHGADSRTIDQEQHIIAAGSDQEENENACRVAMAVLRAYQRIFPLEKKGKAGPSPRHEQELDVTQLTEKDIFNTIPMCDLAQREHNSGFRHDVYDNRIKCGGWRQMNQQASLIGNLRRVGAIEDLEFDRDRPVMSKGNKHVQSNSPYFSRLIIEMGAGRGMTGLILAGVSGRNEYAKTHLTMIERGTSRSRADKSLHRIQVCAKGYIPGYTYLDLSDVDCDRIQCDVSHIDMKWVQLEPSHRDAVDLQLQQESSTSRNREVIVIAKHLCGVGTDLALKSLQPVKHEITACIMATCCHGVCSWKDYVGRDFLMEAMLFDASLLSKFGEVEFDLLRLWSSGTVSDQTDTEEKHSPPTATCTNDPMEIVTVSKIVAALNLQCGARGFGRACQRLIDYGRYQYMRQELFSDTEKEAFNVELIHYVPVADTPQNAALFAYRRDVSAIKKS